MSDGQAPSFSCSACGRSFRWKPEMARRSAKCKCGSVITVPAEPGDAATAAPPPPPPPPPPPLATGSAPAGPIAAACPNCGMNLALGARMCVNCGLDLATGQQAGTYVAPMTGTRSLGGSAGPAASGGTKVSPIVLLKGVGWVLLGLAILVFAWFDLRSEGVPRYRRKLGLIYAVAGKPGVFIVLCIGALLCIAAGAMTILGKDLGNQPNDE